MFAKKGSQENFYKNNKQHPPTVELQTYANVDTFEKNRKPGELLQNQ